MEFKRGGAYLMPVSFGEVPYQPVAAYGDVWSLAAIYLTDRDAMAALLPHPFEPADEPLVTVFYQKCNKVDFLAGGGYNLMGVNLAAVFKGKQDHVRGNYAAVLWENNTIPIVLGRELLGAPKLFGDIPDPFRVGDDWRVQTSDGGRILLEMSIKNSQPVVGQALDLVRAGANATPWMAWRYFPTPDGRGTAVSEPTLVGAEATTDEAWAGTEVSVSFAEVAPEANPMTAHIMSRLGSLVAREYRGGFITHGSSKLLISQNRVLR
jgi:acetoacetate decarboxylase